MLPLSGSMPYLDRISCTRSLRDMKHLDYDGDGFKSKASILWGWQVFRGNLKIGITTQPAKGQKHD